MRTTLRLPDQLARAAKAQAAAEGITLTSLLERALRRDLERASSRDKKSVRLPVEGGQGEQPGVEISDNRSLRDLLDGFDR